MITHWKNDTAAQPPFYAVVFISRKGEDTAGYEATDQRMMELAAQQPGFLGYSSVGGDADHIFISYWESEAHLKSWGEHPEHRRAQQAASRWYRYYHSLVCRVESTREWDQLTGHYSRQ